MEHFADWFMHKCYRFLNKVEAVYFPAVQSCNLFLLMDMFWSLSYSVSALVLDQPYQSSDPSLCREADKAYFPKHPTIPLR